MKVSRVYANKPLINQGPGSPSSVRGKVRRCSRAPGYEAAGMDVASLGCVGTGQPGDTDILVPGSGMLRLWRSGTSHD